jgi:hypothetical protein
LFGTLSGFTIFFHANKEYLLEKGCEPKAIKATAGSLILWDSRTFHQGKEPNKNREIENFRMVCYYV